MFTDLLNFSGFLFSLHTGSNPFITLIQPIQVYPKREKRELNYTIRETRDFPSHERGARTK